MLQCFGCNRVEGVSANKKVLPKTVSLARAVFG